MRNKDSKRFTIFGCVKKWFRSLRETYRTISIQESAMRFPEIFFHFNTTFYSTVRSQPHKLQLNNCSKMEKLSKYWQIIITEGGRVLLPSFRILPIPKKGVGGTQHFPTTTPFKPLIKWKGITQKTNCKKSRPDLTPKSKVMGENVWIKSIKSVRSDRGSNPGTQSDTCLKATLPSSSRCYEVFSGGVTQEG